MSDRLNGKKTHIEMAAVLVCVVLEEDVKGGGKARSRQPFQTEKTCANLASVAYRLRPNILLAFPNLERPQ